uniref:Uncharacterized protein n=1 Tax=Hucho hucho TaxID=62062 RepID=A0A4W5NMB6_9TELE
MVSKYRDILEPQREIGRSSSLSGRSIRHEINSPTSTEHPSSSISEGGRGEKQTPTPMEDSPLASLPHTDSGIGEEGHGPGGLNGAELGLGLGLGLGMAGRETDRDRHRERDGGGGDLLCTLSSEVRRSRESLLDSPHNLNSASNPGQAPPSSISSISQSNKGINVKVLTLSSPLQIVLSPPFLFLSLPSLFLSFSLPFLFLSPPSLSLSPISLSLIPVTLLCFLALCFL